VSCSRRLNDVAEEATRLPASRRRASEPLVRKGVALFAHSAELREDSNASAIVTAFAILFFAAAGGKE
jgi:hypothetical protein